MKTSTFNLSFFSNENRRNLGALGGGEGSELLQLALPSLSTVFRAVSRFCSRFYFFLGTIFEIFFLDFCGVL